MIGPVSPRLLITDSLLFASFGFVGKKYQKAIVILVTVHRHVLKNEVVQRSLSFFRNNQSGNT
jgi:hypothetical protein